MTLEFSRPIFEKYSAVKLHECHPVGCELLHTDRQTDRQTHVTKPIVTFQNFAKAPKETASFPSKVSHMYGDT